MTFTEERFPMTMTIMKTVRHMVCPATSIQSHIVSIHSPHNTRKTIRKEWKKSCMCQRGSVQLHAHHGEDEDDDGQHQSQITQSSH
ncbi:hypothetical protein EYF80_008428 [Liparis tanakae]|uniref:Uncharacterized protein n=1 Tax=Liparis tanakae TaxID=230148 RepID=A0A4Z2IVS8_9TELE|nr:hypothetical protein EYF80_008428 [Liparis tanakae]